ncbi:MAG: hypothetical protein ABI560_16195, partial [Myxococcales bacterium]
MTSAAALSRGLPRGRAWARVGATLACALALAVALGCDGPYQQFLDSVPVDPLPSDVPAQVFLGIDGLSRVNWQFLSSFP